MTWLDGYFYWSDSLATGWTYDALSRMRTMTYPDGEVVTMGYSYDTVTLRLTDLVTTNTSNLVLQNLHYQYDFAGNILHITDGVRSETTDYQYDDLNRLLIASVSNGQNPYAESYIYDPLGNLAQKSRDGTPVNYTYDSNNKPHAVRSAGGATYQYDPNGNMTNRDGDVLTYDVENRLTRIVSGGGTTDYAYNGDGVRVKKMNAGISTFYIGDYYVVSVNGETTTASKYYYFGGRRVAVNLGETLYYLHADHLGSTSVATDVNGNPIGTQTYYPFGSVRTSAGNLPTDYTYTGQHNGFSIEDVFTGGASDGNMLAGQGIPVLARLIQLIAASR